MHPEIVAPQPIDGLDVGRALFDVKRVLVPGRSRPPRFLPIAVSAGAMAVCLSARPTSAAPQQPIFRTNTEHVSLDVVVTDKKDRPITDLTSADFKISDAGRPQTLADFRLVSVPPAHRTVNLAEPTPAPPDVATNGQAAEASRAIAFVFDMSLSPSDIVPWKREMTNFLENMSLDDQMAVAYVGRSDLGQDFTNDPGPLAHAIDNLPAAMFAGQIACGNHPARCTLLVLDNVVKTLAAAHQARKFIVLASAWGCIPAGPHNFYAQACHDLIENAKRADVPIYAIGPPGSFRPSGSLQVLAEETGGRAFVNSPELTATTEILADNGSYYVLGFYPDPLVADGKFHRVKVTVSRPGVRVRARTGYEARASDEAPTSGRAMDVSLAAGLDDPTLPLRATVIPIATTVGGMEALVTVDLVYPTGTGRTRMDDDLRLGVLALDPDGHVRAEHQRPFRISGANQGGGSATIAIDDVIDLPSQQLVLRVGVSSRVLGKTGTVHVPITVPHPTHGDLNLSGIVIGVAGAKPMAVLGADVAAGLVPFQPTTVRTFAATDTLRIFARAFWGSREPSVTATVTLVGDSGRPAMTMICPAVRGDGTPHEAVIDTIIPLARVPPGTHTLQVDARLAGGETVRREIPVEIK